MSYVIVRYLHFIAIAALSIGIIIENMAVKETISGDDAQNLAKVDRVCSIAAICVLLFGLTLWLWVGKPAEFYSSNSLFHVKMGLFLCLVALSAYPTVFFHQNRNSNADELVVPITVRRLLKLEFALLIIIPLFASLVARGVGLNVS